jgi:hypothetical protein
MPVLDEQIDLLEKHAEAGGASQSPCSDLDEVVAAELSVFRQIAQSQDCYRTTEPYSDEAERRFQKRYERWLTAARRTLSRIDRSSAPADGESRIAELRAACERAEILRLGHEASDEDVSAMEESAPSSQALRAAAVTHRPPQQWYEETDCPFTPEPPVDR